MFRDDLYVFLAVRLKYFLFQDANSLAYYNLLPGTVLNLQLKERGGRKK